MLWNISEVSPSCKPTLFCDPRWVWRQVCTVQDVEKKWTLDKNQIRSIILCKIIEVLNLNLHSLYFCNLKYYVFDFCPDSNFFSTSWTVHTCLQTHLGSIQSITFPFFWSIQLCIANAFLMEIVLKSFIMMIEISK